MYLFMHVNFICFPKCKQGTLVALGYHYIKESWTDRKVTVQKGLLKLDCGPECVH